MIESSAIAAILPHFLERQRWVAGRVESVSISSLEVLKSDWPMLVQVLAEGGQNESPAHYHVLVGLRPLGEPAPFLEGLPEGLLGDVATGEGPAFAYDALRDGDLGKFIFELVAPKLESPEVVRPVAAEQSNTSLIYDDKWILKVFRKLIQGQSLDVEVTQALWDNGFQNVPEPVAEWRGESFDFGILRKFIVGGSEGFAMTQTSLRDFLTDGGDPAMAGGDFSSEASRLGEMTARMHLALATAFGSEPGSPLDWAKSLEDTLDRVPVAEIDRAAVNEVVESIRDVADAGKSIRVHGDFHLGQVMRADEGWVVLDFEGEPARPIEERRRPTSPLKDVGGMLRSFHYASQIAAGLQDEVASTAEAWERLNRDSFLKGYLDTEGIAQLIPSDESFSIVLRAFEIEKAIYEVGYEEAYRPEWIKIPLRGLTRLLAGVS
ncbi:MAG: phosphotransferase [Acidimicrobiia bacterium]